MGNGQRLSPRRSLLVYVLAVVGAIVGIIAAPRLIAAAEGSSAWLLPAVVMSAVALGLLVAYAVFRAAVNRPSRKPRACRGEG